jgi:hypothetical protein
MMDNFNEVVNSVKEICEQTFKNIREQSNILEVIVFPEDHELENHRGVFQIKFYCGEFTETPIREILCIIFQDTRSGYYSIVVMNGVEYGSNILFRKITQIPIPALKKYLTQILVSTSNIVLTNCNIKKKIDLRRQDIKLVTNDQ